MKLNARNQKLLIVVLAVVCVALIAVCIVMLSCRGSSDELSPTDEFVYNPGETGFDEDGNTIIIDSDDSTEQLDSIPNGIDSDVSNSDTGDTE